MTAKKDTATATATATAMPEMREKPKSDGFYRILIIAQNGSNFGLFKSSFYKHFGSDSGLSVISRGDHLIENCRKINEVAKPFINFQYDLLIIDETAYSGAYRYAQARTPHETDIIF